MTLAWDAPATDAGSVTGYKVLRRRPDQGENKLLVWETDTGTTETTYKDAYAQDPRGVLRLPGARPARE